MKVRVVHNNKITESEQVVSYLHCGKCLREKPADVSPMHWARLNVGITAKGDIQVWCTRHNVNVDLMHLTTDKVEGVRLTNDCGHE